MSSETVKRLICLIYFRLLCVSVKVWAVEGCRGGLCEVGFATCRTQVPPASSSRATAGHSWSPLPCMWHLWETYLRAKYHMAVWGLRKTVWEPDTKDTEEGVGGCVPGAGAEIPLQPMEDTMVELISTLQTLESPCWNSLILKDCSPWNDRLEQGEQEGIFLKSNPFCPWQ